MKEVKAMCGHDDVSHYVNAINDVNAKIWY